MGREFDQLFDEWAPIYDSTVNGHDLEYREVFNNYEHILESVVSASKGVVLEFGVGTGNLTNKLLARGLKVIGVEPSSVMREFAQRKIPNILIMDGDFLTFTLPGIQVDTIVSTYAFHHLTDQEKHRAISQYKNILSNDGKIVFADTIFTSLEHKNDIINQTKKLNQNRLAKDLETEYYTTIPFLQTILGEEGFESSFQQLNTFVWLLIATPKKKIPKPD